MCGICGKLPGAGWLVLVGEKQVGGGGIIVYQFTCPALNIELLDGRERETREAQNVFSRHNGGPGVQCSACNVM